MSEDKKNKIVLKTDEKVATSLSVSRGGSLFADSIQEAAESLILSTSLKHAITDFSSLSTRISEVCGAVSDLQALTTPLSSKVLWGQLDKAKSSLANVVLGNNWQNKIDSDFEQDIKPPFFISENNAGFHCNNKHFGHYYSHLIYNF